MNMQHEDVLAWLTGRSAAQVEARGFEAQTEHRGHGAHEHADPDDERPAWGEAITHTRRNVADMPTADSNRLKNALAAINTPSNPIWGRFVALHRVLGTIVHGSAGRRFLPWHRLMLWHFERVIRATREGSGAYIPYWTWWQEQSTGRKGIPAAWADFRPDIVMPTLADLDFLRQIGELLSSGTRTAMGNLALGDMINLVIAGFLDPSGTSMLGTSLPVTRIARASLMRGDTSPQGRVLPDRAAVQDVLRRTSFWDMSNRLEDVHGAPHMWAGVNGRADGRISDIGMSPCDILFFFHHAEVDRLWHLWQNTAARRAPWTVTGTELPPWPETIAQVMSIGGAPLELAYENRAIDDPTRTP
ncbi:MAG: tyrosinase family protein [Deltaproteobacteria bacterium]|nr:tyrosinase family protein [Nannocystaceae bacterium]